MKQTLIIIICTIGLVLFWNHAVLPIKKPARPIIIINQGYKCSGRFLDAGDVEWQKPSAALQSRLDSIKFDCNKHKL